MTSPQPIDSVSDLLGQLQTLGLVEPAALDEVRRGRHRAPADLTRQFVRRGWLTPFQADYLLQGRGPELVLDDYCLLEPLGKGGMGQVFKARHRLMHRVVALKVIGDALLAEPGAAERFLREIRLAARLAHPNIVTVHDASQAGVRTFLVMEYCEGQDLGRRVREGGPLPVGLACAYVRQVALGLQHALERGLIHRDIKPANLLVGAAGVKILDLGLARLLDAAGEQAGMSLTQEGAVLGTPDFMAPEQAEDARAVDIRSDLYSLGCTFYFALTGQVPFPGGGLVEKLLRHRLEEPAPLERLRPDVPPAVRAVVRKLMAKAPAGRYQTPAQLAADLEPFAEEDALTRALPPPLSVPAEHRPRSGTAVAPTLPFRAEDETPPPADTERGPARASRRFPRALIAAAAGAVLLAAAALWIFVPGKPDSPAVPAPGPRAWQETGTLLLKGENDALCVAHSPKEDLLAVGCGYLPQGWDWKPRPGRVLLWRLPGDDEAADSIPTPAGPVSSLAFSPDGNTLAVATGLVFRGASYPFDLAPGDLLLWDRETARVRHTRRLHPKGIHALAYHPKGHLLAVATASPAVLLLDANDGEKRGELPGHAGPVLALAFSPDGLWLASGDRGGTVRLWDLSAAAPRAEVLDGPGGGSVSGVAFTRDGGTLLAATHVAPGDRAMVVRWDVATRRPRRTFHGESHIFSLALAPDGRTFVTGCQNGTAWVWDVGRLASEWPFPAGRGFVAAAYSPDGQTLITTGGWGNPVRLWRGRPPAD